MPSTTLTIEEVYGGGGNTGSVYKNDYIVLHNLTNATVDLSSYSVQYASATATSGTFSVTALTGSIAAGGYYLIQESAGTGGSAALPAPDATGTLAISGTTGKVALVSSTTALAGGASATATGVVDFVGWGPTANTYEGSGPAPAASNTTSIVRGNDGNTDTNNNATDFAPATPSNTGHVPYNSASPAHALSGGGATSLSINSISLAEGDAGPTAFTFTVTRAGDLSGTTSVSYATADGVGAGGATVADGDYTAASGTLTFAPTESTKSITVLVNGDTRVEPNETFTLALSNPTPGVTFASGGQTGTATITNDDVTIIGIADIQGASQVSPFAGSTVTTQGVVTALKMGAGGGFYVQDSLTTGPAGASHGLFVFTNATPTGVAVGDAVTVTGLVTEYQAGNNNLSTTELNNPTFTVGTHNNPVTPVVIGVGGLTPPTATIAPATPYNPAVSGADFYESLEGQLVTIHNARAVDATYSGSTWVVADGTAMTGTNARGGITVGATDFNPERIQVYSTGLSASMGEQLGDVTGVLTYYSSNTSQDPNVGGEYELVPTAAITPPGGQSVTAPPVLARPTTTLQGDASHVSIGAYNVENLGSVEPGVAQATVDARFAQLGRDIAQNLRAPDILGLEEIQDADGQGSGADLSGANTLNKLIAAIAAAGGPTYQYVEIAPTTANTNGGAPNGNIRSAYLFNPARVSYVAGSAQLINDPVLSDGDAFANSRHPLAAQFTFNGQTINAIDIHDYARSGSQELFGATQPPVNSGDQRRVDQTAAVNGYVNQLLAADPNAKITVQGDFNGFQFEPTLTQLAHGGGGQLNQLSDLLPANERYSTTFQGDAQEIDHLLVSDALRPNAAFDIVHLNTGQPAANQASDHDPVVSLLAVAAANVPPAFTSGATATAPENVATATAVYTAAATDADNDPVTYALSGADAGKFAINTASGAVTFRASPDFEQPGSAAGTNTYAVAVTASDGAGGHSVAQAVSITVTDVNDNAPVINSAAAASVASGAAAGTVVYTATATDADTVGTRSYLLGGTDAAKFNIDAATGAVSLRGSPSYAAPDDAGADHVYDLTVQASDGVNLSAARAVQITVTAVAAVNASPPVFTSGATASTPENVSTTTAVYTAHATDADGDQVSYALAGGADDGRFNLDAATGALTFKVSPDFEAPGSAAGSNTYAVRVRASDGLASHDVVQAVAVTVTDVAEPQPPVAPAPTPTLPPSQALGLAVQATNLLRAAAGDIALSDASSPLFAQAQAQARIAAQLDGGQVGAADAQAALFHLVDGTTSVAEISYAFFTGRTPTAAGLGYLVHSAVNPTDLNDAYYARFTTENRYINFAANLATGGGAGAASFQAAYGGLSLADATAKAYQAVFGFAPAAGKVDAILNAPVSNGLGGTETRAQYFADITGGPAAAQKAAAIGFLLADSVKEGFGLYQQADLHFLQDLAHGTAAFNVDLLAAYGQAPALVGQPIADPSLGG